MILIDSPYANIANIARALRASGASLEVTHDAAVIAREDKLVLPGVGSFAAAMRWLSENRIDLAIHDAVANGASLLGICVGHQLLFDSSDEMGSTKGLGLIRGDVRKLDGALPVPQIGWNRVRFARPCGAAAASAAETGPGSRGDAEMRRREHQSVLPPRTPRLRVNAQIPAAGAIPSPLFEGIEDGTSFYFVNSYAARDADGEIAAADYSGPFTAAVQRGRVYGVQFHPEKSSTAGLRVLRNFLACN